jgi:hypothetical protein
MPKLEDAGHKPDGRWLIRRIDLVSLLTHEQPVAYVSVNLPRMDELRGAATRPLTQFERRALTALRAGSNLQVDASADHIQMLGAIRAVKQCLDCHDARRADLLGAFSYRLQRR